MFKFFNKLIRSNKSENCPQINTDEFSEKVKEVYSSVAANPYDKHSFPTGRKFAESIGYPKEILDKLPAITVDCFAGVSNVSIYASIPQGAAVLDLGCGAGLDTLIAAQKTGSSGRVIGIDFSEAMINKANFGIKQCGYTNVSLQIEHADTLSLPDSSIDIALVNGIFNLNPFREKIFIELARVIKKGGVVYASELILKEPNISSIVCSLDNWLN
ncbi:MAG: methyltransferase domain-containing protein [Nitrospirae bacterium]|nr:methyltransferase domain-containing protein [Nitrospirota bacterium]MBF0540986.1 methyltransferase domain-containing protein [Nitrospirota bacterium]